MQNLNLHWVGVGECDCILLEFLYGVSCMHGQARQLFFLAGSCASWGVYVRVCVCESVRVGVSCAVWKTINIPAQIWNEKSLTLCLVGKNVYTFV